MLLIKCFTREVERRNISESLLKHIFALTHLTNKFCVIELSFHFNGRFGLWFLFSEYIILGFYTLDGLTVFKFHATEISTKLDFSFEVVAPMSHINRNILHISMTEDLNIAIRHRFFPRLSHG